MNYNLYWGEIHIRIVVILKTHLVQLRKPLKSQSHIWISLPSLSIYHIHRNWTKETKFSSSTGIK